MPRASRAKKKADPTELDGYHAAEKIIEGLMNKAQAQAPKRHPKVRNAAFRAGYFEGLVVCHSLLALGQFPLANSGQIKEALGR
jgi:hypothetical protein